MQIAYVLVNLSDKDVATPVLDFFAFDSWKTRVTLLMWFIFLFGYRWHAIRLMICVLHMYNAAENLVGNVSRLYLMPFIV